MKSQQKIYTNHIQRSNAKPVLHQSTQQSLPEMMILVPQVDKRMRFELNQVKGHLNKAVEAAIMIANELLERHAQRIDDEVSDLSPGKGSSYGQNVSVFFLLCCLSESIHI